MTIEQLLQETTAKAVKELFEADFPQTQIIINETRKEFDGELTVVVFPFVKIAKKKPEDVGDAIGTYLKSEIDQIESFNVIKGFLNLSFVDDFWINKFGELAKKENYGVQESNGKTVVLEYCGPNTNKPLHLGHIRNMVLGYSVANLLTATGHKVHKVNILNDRGIAICKSMLAWQKFGEGATPESTGKKGDHLVGEFYVKFNAVLEEEYSFWKDSDAANEKFKEWLNSKEAKKLKEEYKGEEVLKKDFFKSYSNNYFNEHSALGKETKAMLQKWEAGDSEVRALWEKMNNWVYDGFNQTYERLGIDFEEVYKESEYYEAGKSMVIEGLEKELFYQKDDKSIWTDLEAYKLDKKLLLRKDGTSVYLTQDLAVAQARYDKYKMDISIYTVGDEQDYHFKALKAVLSQMNKAYAEGVYHLSYGMIDLPGGAKMKSREGTVVDADDLIEEVVAKAKQATLESGKIEDFSTEQADKLFEILGVGAIRFFILSIDPKKRMTFDPAQSVELQGFTGPYIQYSYARTQSVLRKYAKSPSTEIAINKLVAEEKDLVIQLNNYEKVVQEAAKQYEPSLIAHYVYNLAKSYNKFYAECPILKNDDEKITDFRVLLSQKVGEVIKKGLALLGIQSPERM